MRATGIIRRVDDLGRVVIPKEVRRAMNIREGMPLEIFIDKENNAVCFIPYHNAGIKDKLLDLENDFKYLLLDEGKYNKWNEAKNLLNGLKKLVKEEEGE